LCKLVFVKQLSGEQKRPLFAHPTMRHFYSMIVVVMCCGIMVLLFFNPKGVTVSSLDLTVYSAFVSAGVKDEDAKRAAESISSAIDGRFALHSKMLATQGDLEKVRLEIEKLRVEMEHSKTDIIRWNIVTMFGGLSALALIQKLL
jgi:hypothetical protein